MAKTSIVQRPGKDGDGAALYAVTWSSVRGLLPGHYSADQLKIWMGRRDADCHEDLLKHGMTVIAERAGRAVGFVHTLPGEINRLFVIPEEAGKGLGKQLLETGLKKCA
jgi:GNAT superfamily N-acetyltransferase